MISQTSNKPYFLLKNKLFKQAFTFYATNNKALEAKFSFLIDLAFKSLWSYLLEKRGKYRHLPRFK